MFQQAQCMYIWSLILWSHFISQIDWSIHRLETRGWDKMGNWQPMLQLNFISKKLKHFKFKLPDTMAITSFRTVASEIMSKFLTMNIKTTEVTLRTKPILSLKYMRDTLLGFYFFFSRKYKLRTRKTSPSQRLPSQVMDTVKARNFHKRRGIRCMQALYSCIRK